MTISHSKNNAVQPLVSIIIPSFNRPYLLKEALMSVRSQHYENYEIIVVNDAGVDIKNVIASVNNDGKIIYLQHEKNKGLAAARNTGIKAARGKYIAYLDDDDIYYPHHLKTLVKCLEESDYKVAYTDSYHAYQCLLTGKYITVEKQASHSFDFDRSTLLVENYVPVINVMHTKDILDKAGLFDESLRAHEDWDLWIRLSRYSDFCHIKEITSEVHIRNDASNMITGDKSRFLKSIRAIHAKYANFVDDDKVLEKQKQAEEVLEKLVDVQNMSSVVIQCGHLHKYSFATNVVKGKSVLDLKCGEGYGCSMLAKNASEVIALDHNYELIKHASSRYKKENLRFIRGSITDLPLKTGHPFDVVIYFQGIEATKEHDALVKKIKSILSDDGILVMSVFNAYFACATQKWEDKIYSTKLYLKDFRSTIDRHFENTYFYGQKVYPSSKVFHLFNGENGEKIIKDYAIKKSGNAFRFVSEDSMEIEHLIVIASDRPVRDLDVKAYHLDFSEALFTSKDLRLDHVEQKIEGLSSEVQRLHNQINQTYDVIEAKDKRIEAKDKHIQNIETELNLIRQSKAWRIAEYLRWLIYGKLLRRFKLP